MKGRWVVLLVVVTNLLTLLVVLGVRWHDDTYRFNVAKWHARSPYGCDDEHRQDMVGDLAKGGYLRVGMSRAEVLWTLGPPDYADRRVLTWDTGRVFSDCPGFSVVFGAKGQQVVDWDSRPRKKPEEEQGAGWVSRTPSG